MSHIDELIQDFCPNGVEFVPLGELLAYEQPTRYLVASTAYSDSFATPVLTAGQTFILGRTDETNGVYPASATSPVVIFDDFTTAFKWVDFPFKAKSSAMKMLTPKDSARALLRFVYYVMQTIRYEPQDHTRQWIGTYSGFRVPVPPLEVQREIVRVLDQFTQLEAELEAELKARRVQYDFYRDSLLTFPADTPLAPLGELGTIFCGLTGKSKADFSDGNARYATYTNVFNNIALNIEANDFVRVGSDERQRSLAYGDVIFTGSSESLEEVGMTSVVTRQLTEPLYLNSFCIGFRMNDASLLNPEFAKHLFRSGPLRAQITKTANGVTRINVSKVRLAKILVPVPPTADQERIARILDLFEVLTGDLRIGLPAEIAARRKQYEYYRGRLLTFEEAAA